MTATDLVLALDIGGTKMAAGLVDPDGKVHFSGRIPTPARSDADVMWTALTKVIGDVMRAGGNPRIIGVGIGSAGPMVWPDGVISPLNIPGWRGFPLRRKVKDLWPGIPVRLHNDAVALAIAEHWKGAAVGYANALGMVVSTGIGGGIILGNRLIDGSLGNAGHIGHVVVFPDGPACGCGGRGYLEPIARGPATVAWAVEQGWSPRDKRKPVDAKTLAQDAAAGDEIAIAAYDRSGEAIGITLASVAALLDLDITVIGGGMVQSGDILMTPLLAAFERYAKLPHAAKMKITTAELGQNAGLIGAAALVQDGDRYWNASDD